MPQWNWFDDGNGRQVYRVVTPLDPRTDAERTRAAIAAIMAARDQHPAEPADEDTSATVTTIAGDEVPSPEDATPHGQLRRYIYLHGRRKALDAETAAVKAELREIDKHLQDAWADDGVSRVTLDGVTAYLYPVSHVEKVGDATPADIRAALTRSGLGYMLEPNYSAPALKALLKEWDEKGTDMPAPLAEVVKLVTNQEVRLRAATASTRRAQG